MRYIMPLLMTGLLTAIGCQKSSPQGGMPNAGNKSAFSIQVPATAVNVTQGDKDEVNIAIKRGSDFTSDVMVEVEVPAGVTVEPKTFTLAQGTNSQKVTLHADADAAPGVRVARVNATPSSGMPTSAQFDVSVKTK